MTAATLTTARLSLRAGQAGDAEPLGRFIAGPRSPGIGGPYPASAAAGWVADDLANCENRGSGLWIVTLTATGEVMGRTGVLHHDGWPAPELAWHLYDGVERQGFAHEAARAARDCCDRVPGLPPMVSLIDADNPASIRVAERLGATCEAPHPLPDSDGIHRWRHPARGQP